MIFSLSYLLTLCQKKSTIKKDIKAAGRFFGEKVTGKVKVYGFCSFKRVQG